MISGIIDDENISIPIVYVTVPHDAVADPPVDGTPTNT
jgi:hypothetical protein